VVEDKEGIHMEMLLNNCLWKVKGFYPHVPFLGKSMELGQELLGVTEWLEASVPGGVHGDLLKAGLIENPHYEMNSLKCEWVENRWWMYKTTFQLPQEYQGRNLTLCFKGVDYKAHFFLNRKMLGEHEGMYEHVQFDITDGIVQDEENELVVLLENAPEEMAQIGHTSMSRTQKSRFNYKWDFSTRLVNIGLWDDVLIRTRGSCSFRDTHISTDIENKAGLIKLQTCIAGSTGKSCEVRVLVAFNGERLYEQNKLLVLQGDSCPWEESIELQNSKLWYPNGAGDQPLYKVRLEVYENGRLSDEQEYQTGIRSLHYEKNPGSPEDALPYTFVVNGKPIYIKGVNLAPFDLLYGNVTRETYEKYIQLLKHANINMVRVWGGGLIEKEYFYHLCDSNGILVWQEFIQSSSGIDNIPSKDPHFLKLLKATAIQALKDRRNHVCHTVWSGGNELTDKDGIPAAYEDANIKMLQELVEEWDPNKLFLPTSASGPNEFLNIEQPGRNYDVHGSWKYEGAERHYKVYNASDSLFHSEFGVDGCSSTAALRRFLGPAHLKVTNMKEDLVWRHHGEWWDTLDRDRELFGEFATLEQFTKASQFMQAEGLRYALEANRRRKFRNSGSIVWQFNEPWPNISNTCMVEYYGVPKMAYYWLRKAYSPIHASLSYEKLFYPLGEQFTGELYIHNSLKEQPLILEWEILDSSGRILREEKVKQTVGSNTALKVKDITWENSLAADGIFFIRLKLYDTDGMELSRNLYVFSQREKEIFSALLTGKQGELQIENRGETCRIKNSGDKVCLFVHGVEKSGTRCVLIGGNYDSLFPGEEREFTIKALDSEPSIPEMQWDYFR
jgi:beta-mannosidase